MGCVTTETHLDLVLDDVAAGARFFRQVLALPVIECDDDHAVALLADDLTAHLRTASAESRPAVRRGPGTILQLQVPELRGAVAELRRRGATILVEPVLTDWGTQSAFVAGPGDVIIEVYCPLEG
jgi:catechol 2,3-dioxygenase-like lactoylglutathione lyase family enzyme